MGDILDEAKYQANHACGILPKQRWGDVVVEIERLRARHSLDNERMAEMVEGEIEFLARIEELEKTWLDLMVVAGGFNEVVASVPFLPGLIGVGDTTEEAKRTALGFVPLWIETAKERGEL